MKRNLLIHGLLLLCALMSGSYLWASEVTLSATQIQAGTGSSKSPGPCKATDNKGNVWNAYAMKGTTANSSYPEYESFIIKKCTSSNFYYIQLPVLGNKINNITLTVSDVSMPRTGGNNTTTVYFSNSKSTAEDGKGVVSGTGYYTITLNVSSLNLNTGYITANGDIRIWDIKVTYDVPTVVPVAVSQYEWATFVYNEPLDFSGSEVNAYVVNGHEGNALVKDQVTRVAANTPLLLSAASGNYNITVAESGTSYAGSNKLVAGEGEAISAEEGKTKYVLSVADSKAVFKRIGSTSATVGTSKAYLQFDENVAAPVFGFEEWAETTGLDPVISNHCPESTVRGYYNLAGQRVAQPVRGLYIVDGRKIVFP